MKRNPRYKPVGWRGEPHRHYLAAKGIRTKHWFAEKRGKRSRRRKGDEPVGEAQPKGQQEFDTQTAERIKRLPGGTFEEALKVFSAAQGSQEEQRELERTRSNLTTLKEKRKDLQTEIAEYDAMRKQLNSLEKQFNSPNISEEQRADIADQIEELKQEMQKELQREIVIEGNTITVEQALNEIGGLKSTIGKMQDRVDELTGVGERKRRPFAAGQTNERALRMMPKAALQAAFKTGQQGSKEELIERILEEKSPEQVRAFRALIDHEIQRRQLQTQLEDASGERRNILKKRIAEQNKKIEELAQKGDLDTKRTEQLSQFAEQQKKRRERLVQRGREPADEQEKEMLQKELRRALANNDQDKIEYLRERLEPSVYEKTLNLVKQIERQRAEQQKDLVGRPMETEGTQKEVRLPAGDIKRFTQSRSATREGEVDEAESEARKESKPSKQPGEKEDETMAWKYMAKKKSPDVEKIRKDLKPGEAIVAAPVLRTIKSIEQVNKSNYGGFRAKEE